MKHKFLARSLVMTGLLGVLVTVTSCGLFPNSTDNGGGDEVGNITVDNTSYEVWDGSVATKFPAGKGSAQNPYQISTGAELAYFAELINNGDEEYNSAHYCLINSIDLNGLDWTPIGFYQENWTGTRPNNTYKSFYGVFDGNDCIIKNYKINQKSSEEIGFFSDLNEGTIRNLGLIGNVGASSSTTATYLVGGLVGWNRGGIIENCFVSGNVQFTTTTGECQVGGIASFNSGTIRNCFFIGDVSAYYRAQITYGLQNYKSTIAGGIAAFNDGKIENSFVKGNVYAYSSNKSATAGGVVGENDGGGKINNVYALGSVEADGCDLMAIIQGTSEKTSCYVGGLVGNLRGTIKNSYTITDVEGYATSQIYAGRVFGTVYSSAQEENVFYVAEKVLTYEKFIYTNDAEKNICENGSGITEILVKTKSFIAGLNWDQTQWQISDGNNPYLKGLPNSFTVYFQETNKEVMYLDVEGYRELAGYSAGIYQKTGYEFVGWMDSKTQEVISDNEGIINPEVVLTSDIVLTAKLTPIVYTAKFYADDVLIATVEFTIEDEAIDEPEVPEKEGYIGSWEPYSLQADNIVVKAQYIPIE